MYNFCDFVLGTKRGTTAALQVSNGHFVGLPVLWQGK